MSVPWFKFFPNDWLAGTSGMTPSERGIYITIIALIYEMGEAVLHDEGRLSRRCGCNKSTFKRALKVLVADGKLTISDNRVSNKRAEKELSERIKRIEKATTGGQQKAASERKKMQQKQREKNGLAGSKHRKYAAISEPELELKKEDTNVSSKKKATRLSTDWVLPDDWLEWGVSQGWTSQDLQLEADKFKDYWISKSSDARKLDWQAVWRNWLRNSRNLKPKFLQIQGAENGFTDSKSDQRLQAFLGGARRTS